MTATQGDQMRKLYISVTVEFDPSGNMKPLSIRWTDDRVYEIDRIIKVGKTDASKVGTAGKCYTCVIAGKRTELYLDQIAEPYRWFMIAKD